MAIEFQLSRANQNRKNIHTGLKLPHGQGQSDAQNIASRRLGFHLSPLHGLQKGDGKKSLRKPRSQHLNIDGVGQIAQTPRKRQIHGLHPIEQGVGTRRKQMIISFVG